MTRRPATVAPSESQIQRAFVEWCRMSEAKYPALRLAFSVPNGGLRNIVTATRLKREGARAGVPDWILPVRWEKPGPVTLIKANGLMLEFKKPGGRATREQKAYHSLARIYGHRVEIVTSTEQAIALVKEYLS